VPGIELTFPAGRYHATPWDAHVNEGVVEWPPSPWRILRALVATRHLKARDLVSEEALAELMEALSATPPSYGLPPAAGFHTRHYMPLFAAKTTKVFDTFLHLPEGSRVVVSWPEGTLEKAPVEALAHLAERLGYLGRAESWVEARWTEDDVVEPACRPRFRAAEAGTGTGAEDHGERDLVRLLAPLGPQALDAWRRGALEDREARELGRKRERTRRKGKPVDGLKLTPRERAKLEIGLPRGVLEALGAETDRLRKQGWNRPPGSGWIEYLRPRLELPVRRAANGRKSLPTVARYALSGAVLPRLTDAVLEAEKIRTSLLSHSDAAPVFSGRDPETGTILTGHRHAFVLPETSGRHGLITHVTVYARMGFGDRARAALERLRRVWQRGGHDLQLVLLGMGHPKDFADPVRTEESCSLLAASTTWVSRTPFVPTRHPKLRRNGEPKLDGEGLAIGSPEHDLRRLLREQGFPSPISVERRAEALLGGKPTRWLAFRTDRRKGGGRRAGTIRSGFRIVFPEPVRGPIAVGYGAHFGMGCFVPERS